ncbi:MAG: amino acid adenylation domain-containing protein, partial [Cyclobacteriaceae bacterium]
EGAIRFHIGSILPSYMIPDYYICLPAFPLNQNGKVDRMVLSSETKMSRGDEIVAAITDTEQQLIEQWEGLLNREIGRNDNFFHVGGHSLKAVRLIGLIHEQFSISFSLKDIFDCPVLKDLAAMIDYSEKDKTSNLIAYEEQDYYPVSNAQKRLWILHQYENAKSAYNLPLIYKVSTNLDKIEYAVKALIDKHEVLRTNFLELDGSLRQRVIKVDFNKLIKVKDLKTLTNEGYSITQYLHKETNYQFNLDSEPLIKVCIIEMESFSYILSIVLHHIISDGWSSEVITNELSQYLSLNDNSNDNSLQLQYKDYTIWQNQLLKAGVFEQSRNYWSKQLGSGAKVLNLPTDFPRTGQKRYKGAFLSNDISNSQLAWIRTYSKQKGTTSFTTLLTILKTLLYRYTGEIDIIVGNVIAGREQYNLQNQLGFYTNTLAIRTSIVENDNFDMLHKKVKSGLFSAYSHQNYPFDKVVDDLSLTGDKASSPLFNIVVTYDNRTTTKGESVLVDVSDEFNYSSAKFDIVFSFTEYQDSLTLSVNYDVDLFEEKSISRKIKHYKVLLDSIISDSQAVLHKLNYLTNDEYQAGLNLRNNTRTIYPHESTVHALFEDIVANHSDKVGLVLNDQYFTYDFLHTKSNQVGNELLRLGVEKGQVVGILASRSESLIIGMLGCLKSGAGYLPLDANSPEERLRLMMKDANLDFVLYDKSELTDVPNINGVRFVAVNNLLKEGDESDISSKVLSEDLCYVIYTSGSTGIPKGVMTSHKGVVRLLKNTNYANLSSKDCFLQTGGLAFDASVFEIWGSLLHGAELHLMSESSLLDFAYVNSYVASHGVNKMFMVTSFFNQLIVENKEVLNQLEYLLVGGEELGLSTLDRIAGFDSNLNIVNAYGPTENSMISTTYQLKGNDVSIPIGQPIANSTVYLIDDYEQLVGDGVIGEICVGGDGLSMGYLNRPELTNKLFINNPYEQGQKLFKTGDLGRWNNDGQLQFIGRKDDQVKVHGYRVELGEISSYVEKYDGVRQSETVLILNDGLKHLINYYTSESELDNYDLRNFLYEKLPSYMVPEQFVYLKSLPLTINGKIDRNNLPLPDFSIKQNIKSSDNLVEEELLKIWRKILNREDVGVSDNFFNLGGHSLKAMRVLSEIHKTFGKKVPLSDFFAFPTIEDLLTQVLTKEKTEARKIYAIEEQDFYELSHAQKRLWILDNYYGEKLAYVVPGAILIEGNLDKSLFEKAFYNVILRHEILRTRFPKVGELPKQKILSADSVNTQIEFLDISDNENKEAIVANIYKMESESAIDLEEGPIFRAKLVKLASDRHQFIMVMHHIISDAWSTDILVNEVFSLIQKLSNSMNANIEPLSIQYKDYTAWQNAAINSQFMNTQRDYWHAKLEKVERLILPTDFERPESKSTNGDTVELIISKDMTASLHKIQKEQGTSLFVLLVSLVKVLLYRYSDQEKIATGIPIAGRNTPQLEGQVGFYVNSLVLFDELNGDAKFEELLSNIHANCMEAFENQDYPFDLLVEELSLEKDMSRTPLFDVMIMLQNSTELTKKTVGNLTISDSSFIIGTSKFDLLYSFQELDDEIHLELEYNTDLFKKDTVLAMCENLDKIIEGVVENIRTPIGSLDLHKNVAQEAILSYLK